uniref:Sex pheromone cAM373 n=1 Tax=Enterococcus faecalis TaxID=1351 RepID=CIA_ENTFL|nr:RecName: Full=Sex pheromone cAM373; AltName: Full=Clumping-inducing agent; Short=CIA [Enterococcus faecalis]
AIFILAS